MLTINYGEQSFQIKNSMDELSVKEFEFISSTLNDEQQVYVEKWSNIFVHLGVPQDVVDDFESFDFIELIKNFNISESENAEIIKEIELDGNVYKAFDDKFKLTVKEMTLIEGFVKKNKDRYLGEIMAVIYKREDIDKNMVYDKAHIKYKAELIRKEIKAEVAMPILSYLGKKLIKDYNLIVENGA